MKNNNRNSKLKIILGMMVVFMMISACNLGSFRGNQDERLEATSTPMVSRDPDSISDSDMSEMDELKNQVEMVTLYKLDGTEEVVPRTYTGFSDLLDAKVEKGEWTQGGGLVIILKYFLGEVEIKEYPEFEYVLEDNGTGILRLALEYKIQNPEDTELINELNRLISQLKPSDEVLDLISQPANATSNAGNTKIAMPNKQASADSCGNFQQLGFDLDHFNGEHCYVYEEAMVNGQTYRIYYPSWWQGDETMKVILDNSLVALTDSAATYSEFGNFYDINMIISLTTYPDLANVLAIQHPISGTETCPVTFFNTFGGMSIDVFKQIVAHEAFHCFQDWNTPYNDYDSNKWWVEGSAEFFSNIVYPTTNYEHRFLDEFDKNSIRISINKMSYENFLIFQQLGNVYGDIEVINLLKSLAVSGGSIATLSGYDDMAKTFQDFVVAFMSTGIQDTGGGMISVGNPAVIKTETIDQEKEEKFSIQPFVSGRYRMNYKQEKRFLQSPDEDGDGKYSTAEFDLRKDLSSWSSLPPEIRTKCDEDLLYALVVTTTETSGQFNLIANIEKMEEAECDPCLLGVWEVDNPSYEVFIKRLYESQGGLEDLPPGMELRLEVEGHYYVEFKEKSELLTRRDKFTVISGAVGFPGLKTIIDSQGNGEYSTTDGKRLSLYNMVDYANQVEAYIEDMPINVNMTPGASTYSMFGASSSGPGFESDSGQDNVTSDYICEENELIIDDPEYGELLYNRVEKILPTPVPTMSP